LRTGMLMFYTVILIQQLLTNDAIKALHVILASSRLHDNFKLNV